MSGARFLDRMGGSRPATTFPFSDQSVLADQLYHQGAIYRRPAAAAWLKRFLAIMLFLFTTFLDHRAVNFLNGDIVT